MPGRRVRKGGRRKDCLPAYLPQSGGRKRTGKTWKDGGRSLPTKQGFRQRTKKREFLCSHLDAGVALHSRLKKGNHFALTGKSYKVCPKTLIPTELEGKCFPRWISISRFIKKGTKLLIIIIILRILGFKGLSRITDQIPPRRRIDILFALILFWYFFFFLALINAHCCSLSRPYVLVFEYFQKGRIFIYNFIVLLTQVLIACLPHEDRKETQVWQTRNITPRKFKLNS